MKHVIYAIFPGTQAQADALKIFDHSGPLAGTTTPIMRKHGIVADGASNAGCIYAATWNGTDPYVILQVGTVALINLAFLGWPMIDKTAWDLVNP